MKHARTKTLGRALLVLSAVAVVAVACKDESPCDDYEVSIGTGCYPRPDAGEGGAGNVGGAGPGPGNPDASFGTACESDADCGGEAPICDTQQFHYCLQIECQQGEANEGACPADWTCFKYQDNPSACIKL